MSTNNKDYLYRIIIDSVDQEKWNAGRNASQILPFNPFHWSDERYRTLSAAKGLVTRLADNGVIAHIEEGTIVWRVMLDD